jgi:hypothetical protein
MRPVLPGDAAKQHRARAAATATPNFRSGSSQNAPDGISAPFQHQQKQAMYTAVTVVQKIMTEFIGAVSEKAKILAATKIVLKLKKQNGQ